MLDAPSASVTPSADAERSGRASRKENMARPRYQDGSLVVRGKRRTMWVIRWREDVRQPDGSVKRIQHAETLGPVSQITRQSARAVLHSKVQDQSQRRPQATMLFADFVLAEWRPTVALALKKSTVRYYNYQLEKRINPVLGYCPLCELGRSRIEALLTNLSQKGHAGGTIRGVRSTLSSVLQAAVNRGYLDKNPAHGIRIRHTGMKYVPRFYSPAQIRQLVGELREPCPFGVLVILLPPSKYKDDVVGSLDRVDLVAVRRCWLYY